MASGPTRREALAQAVGAVATLAGFGERSDTTMVNITDPNYDTNNQVGDAWDYNDDFTDLESRLQGIGTDAIKKGYVNGIESVETTEGVAAVQTAVNEHPYVVVYGPDADWGASLEVPSNTTLRQIGSGTITISNPATNLTKYDAPHGGSVAAVFTNADHTNGNENVRIEGFDIDYNGSNVTVDPDVYYAGVWLRNVTASSVSDVTADNVVLHANDNGSRAYGIVVTECVAPNEDKAAAAIRDCLATRCGYEGIGVRGRNVNVVVEGCGAYNNDTHSFQAAGWTGSGDDSARPENITFRDCHGDQTFIHHGFPTGTRGDRNIVFERCTMPDSRSAKIQLFDKSVDTTIRDCTGQVEIKTRTDGIYRNIAIENLTATQTGTTAADSPIFISAQEDNWTLNGLTIRDTHAVRDKLLTIYDAGLDTDASGYRIRNVTLENCSIIEPAGHSGASMIVRPLDSVVTENLTMRDCWADANRFVHGAGIIEAFHPHQNDATNVNDIVTSSGTTIASASRNKGFDPEGPTDLSTVHGYWDGQRAIDNGTNTTSTNPETFVWEVDTWYSASGDSITPA